MRVLLLKRAHPRILPESTARRIAVDTKGVFQIDRALPRDAESVAMWFWCSD